MELRRELLTAEMGEPGSGRLIRTPIEVRFDPLTGHTSRILPERGLMPKNDFDLKAFADATQPSCPFCGDRITRLTPTLAVSSAPAGHRRLRAHTLQRLLADAPAARFEAYLDTERRDGERCLGSTG